MIGPGGEPNARRFSLPGPSSSVEVELPGHKMAAPDVSRPSRHTHCRDAGDLTAAYYSGREWHERPAASVPRRRSLTPTVQPAIAVAIFSRSLRGTR